MLLVLSSTLVWGKAAGARGKVIILVLGAALERNTVKIMHKGG